MQYIYHKEDNLYYVIQGNVISLEAQIVPKSLALTSLVNSHFQGHACINRTYCLIKRNLFWKGIEKDINKFIQKCHSLSSPNSEIIIQFYSNDTIQKLFEILAYDLMSPFTHQLQGNCTMLMYMSSHKFPNRNTFIRQNSWNSCYSLPTTCVWHLCRFPFSLITDKGI